MDDNEKSRLEKELQDSLDGIYNDCIRIIWKGIDIIEKDILNDPSIINEVEKNDIHERLNKFCTSQEKSLAFFYDRFEEYTRRFVKNLQTEHLNRMKMINQSPTVFSQSRNYSSQIEYQNNLKSNPELLDLQNQIRKEYSEYVRLKKTKSEIDREVEYFENNSKHLEDVSKQFMEEKGEEKEIFQFVNDLHNVGAPLSKTIQDGKKLDDEYFGQDEREENEGEFNFRNDPNEENVHFPKQNMDQYENIFGNEGNERTGKKSMDLSDE